MRPHRLEVTAFGAFAATSAVRFDDLEGLFLLHGETGAGKTTLLDAIAFALYGRVPGERGKTRRLRSDHAPAGRRTEVRLEATVGGRRLRITRSPEQERPRKSGEGMTTERARVLLEECLGDGTWQTKSTRAGEADAEIADLMGMSAEQFFQVVLLPQGQFAQFLHSDAEARARLLQRLFGTDRFRAVEDWLAERRRSTAAEVAAAEEGVDVLTAQVAQAAGVPVPDGPPENEPGPADPGTSPATLPGNLPADPGACKPPTSPGQRPLNAQHDHLFAAPPDNSSGASSPEAASFASSPEAASFTRSPEAASFAPSSQGVSSAPSSQGASSIPSSENRWQRAWAAGLLAAAEAERDATAAVARERSRELKAALRAQRAAELLVDRQHRRADALRRDGELRLAAPGIELLRAELDAAERAAGVAPVQDEAERAADAAGAARQAEQDSRAALGADAAALRVAGAAGLRAAVQQRREQLGRLEALRAVALQAADEEEAAAAARAQANALAAALEALHVETARFAGQRGHAAAARDAASQAQADLPDARAEAGRYRRAANDAAELASTLAERERLHEAHLSARETSLTLREEAQRLREARFDGMRAELAAALVDGTPCPVCGSLDHPDLCELSGERVSREREEQAVAAAEDAAGRADESGQRVAAADALIEKLVQRLAADGFTAPDAGALAADAGRLEAEAARLEADAGRVAAAAAELGDRQAVLDDLDAALARAEKAKVELAEQRIAADGEAAGAQRRAAECRDSLRAELGGAPDLDSAVTAVRRLADALTAAAAAADETARAAAAAREAGERAARAAADAGFAGPEAAREALRDTEWRRRSADRIAGHEAEAKAVAGLLAAPDLDVPLEPPAAVEETAEAVAAAQEAHDAALEAASRADLRAEQLTGLVPRLGEALAALEPLTARAAEARRLADLAAGQGANTLRMTLSSFVLAARLEEVAAAASQRLLTMTAGRYSLVHTDARRGGGRAGLGLLACDSWTGLDRDTSTLSGGETFLASLALALGLADVVTAEAAGTPMEALFVDEGFGTLDEDTLDEVMNVLDGLREGGRIVGIVSHVAELRQRIPAQVRVLKGHHGSRVELIPG